MQSKVGRLLDTAGADVVDEALENCQAVAVTIEAWLSRTPTPQHAEWDDVNENCCCIFARGWK